MFIKYDNNRNNKTSQIIEKENSETLIYEIRGKQVMLNFDLVNNTIKYQKVQKNELFFTFALHFKKNIV